MGLFLEAAARAGYGTFGIGLSPKNAALAEDKEHTLFVGSLAEYASDSPKTVFH